MSLEWCLNAGCREDESLFDESCAVEQAFKHFFELGLDGGLLRVKGRPIAFAMGEPLNFDTYVIHIEKAFHEIQGAYQMINQQFAAANCGNFTYVNREDDAGDEGLRRAKLSYDPAFLLEKARGADFNAVIGHPGADDLPQLSALWREAFGDTEEETAFFFQYRHRAENMLVLRLEDRIAGMLTMLPVALLAGGKALKARYVFAIATKESYRNRGVSTQLLAAANAAAAAEGCAATLLVPANERLFVFYGKRAYETTFYTSSKRRRLQRAGRRAFSPAWLTNSQM